MAIFSFPLMLSLSKHGPERTETSFDKLRMRLRLVSGSISDQALRMSASNKHTP